MKSLNFKINPEGSNFSYEELLRITEQCLSFYRRASGRETAPVTRTTETRGTFTDRVISFLPKEEFSRPNSILALAAAGILVNQWTTRHLTLYEMRELFMHEFGHNFGLTHDPDSRYTVMTTARFRTMSDFSLLWRQDYIGLGSTVGLITVDEDLSIMIPAITSNGEQWSARLRELKTGVWIIDKSYFADDGVHMEEKAILTEDNELHMFDVHFLDLRFPVVKMRISPDMKFRLVG